VRILVGVSGGIAVHKALDIVSALTKAKHDVQVVMTENARRFVSDMPFSVLTGNPVHTSLWDEVEGRVTHIDLAKWTEMVVLVPATANTIAKVAHGLADDLLTTICLAIRPGTRRIVFPAMNTYMWRAWATVRNCAQLDLWGWEIFPPVSGELACRDTGEGKLPDVDDIVAHINDAARGGLPLWPLPGIKYHSHGRGSFGVVRKFDRHTGVDLYAPVGQGVVAMDAGKLVHVGPFTGPEVQCGHYPNGSPWWLPTDCVVIDQGDILVLYGEITASRNIRAKWKCPSDYGRDIERGEPIGEVARVLRHDKGTPTSMLHLEQLRSWDDGCPLVWGRDQINPPDPLMDVTLMVERAKLLQ
jgi:phosphopantothenoylcysteine decarboxylase